LRGFGGAGAAKQRAGSGERERNAEEVEREQDYRERKVRRADGRGHERSKDGEAKVLGDKLSEVGKERTVEGELDARDVEAAVFGERVIAVDEKCREGECGE
jgi:hypothetical protein